MNSNVEGWQIIQNEPNGSARINNSDHNSLASNTGKEDIMILEETQSQDK